MIKPGCKADVVTVAIFVGPNVPVMNESTNEMIYEVNHILNCGHEIK